MNKRTFSSKEILLTQLLGECAKLLKEAFLRLEEDKFQEVAEFADFAHHQLVDELAGDKKSSI